MDAHEPNDSGSESDESSDLSEIDLGSESSASADEDELPASEEVIGDEPELLSAGDSEWEDVEVKEVTANASSSESSSDDGQADKCCICLQKFRGQLIGMPDECDHQFCRICLTEWAKTSQTCPIDRKPFHSILVTLGGDSILRVEELEVENWDSLSPRRLEDDVSQCEVCGRGDREDRLLLCDECNLAYHLECLDPPLEYVPIEDWFCPNCTALQIARPSTSTLGPPPHIVFPEPADIQSSLLTRRIRQRRQKSRRKIVRGRRTKKRKTPARKTKTSKSKAKSKTKTKSTRKPKAKRKVRRVRKRKTRKVRPRVVAQEKPSTSRARIAQHLGIVPPKPGQVYIGLPTCRTITQSSATSATMDSFNHQRFRAGISTLRLFSHHDDLADCLENPSDDESMGQGSVATLRPHAHHRNAFIPAKLSSPFLGEFNITDPGQTSSPNILSQIMNSQQILLQDRNIRIGRDGTLIPSEQQNSNQTGPTNTFSFLVNGTGKAKPEDRRLIMRTPTAAIRQTPMNNSESPSTQNQKSNYTNSNSVSSNTAGTSELRSDTGNGLNMLSHFRTNEDGGAQRSNSFGDQNSFSNDLKIDPPIMKSPIKSAVKNKSEEDKKPAMEDDDDFNIYSDIEEEPHHGPSCEENESTINFQTELMGEKDKESDNENEMIIVEDSSQAIKPNELGDRAIRIEEAADPVPLPNIESDESTSPAMPNADSPESIPLPDSTPPPSVSPVREEAELNEIHSSSILYSPSDDELGGQEYDPSQPLTSSDEEEQIKNKSKTSKNSTPQKAESKEGKVDGSENTQAITLDLSSIPIPADDYRRPTIQFSIPTRHKLIPISSLIKRQKGVVRKESSSSSTNYQSEVSRAFGADASVNNADGETVEEGSGVSNITERPSLIAEVFGSDDEDEASNAENPEKPSELAPAPANLPEKLQSASESSAFENDSLKSNKWKRVEIVASEESQPKEATVLTENNTKITQSDNRTISSENESTLLKVEQSGANRAANQNMSSSRKNATSYLELISDSEDEVTIISPPKQNKTQDENPDIIVISSEKSSSSSDKAQKKPKRQDSKDRSELKERDNSEDRLSRREKDDRNSRPHKRRHSSSSISNYEEGEIPSTDKKKKKTKKNKKVKKRRKSRDSRSPPRAGFNEKQPERDRSQNSGSDADQNGRKVSWRKLSKSTKERNYRDGKPKTEEKYFREKEKAESSARNRLEKGENWDKSPHHRSKVSENDKRINKNDSRRNRRRSNSRENSVSKSPIRWSKSRSTSRGRYKSKRSRNRSRSLSSRKSFSPRHSTHSRYPRKERSRSRTPVRLRSRSPAIERHRSRRRSRSVNRGRLSHKKSGRAQSTSVSRSGSRGKPAKRAEEPDSSDKAKKVNVRKEKEKVVKDTSSTVEPDNDIKDKEKKKKKRRKEKSVSPAKAVFADGDSIVVSLNFQQSKEQKAKEDGAINDTNETKNDESGERKKKRTSCRDSVSSASKAKPLKKTVLIDLETSPIQEQKIGDSPALVVLSDDEEELGLSSFSRKGKEGHHADKSRDNLGTSSGVDNQAVSPTFQHVLADSTQINQSDTAKLNESILGHSGEKRVPSPVKGESVVTSTRDSVEGTAVIDDDAGIMKSPNSEITAIRKGPPSTTASPLTTSPLSRLDTSSKTDTFKRTPTSSAPLQSNNAPPLPTAPGTHEQGLTRPLGIGSIPGLFASNLASSGITLPPAPVVIPPTPSPQLRFPSMNPSINILASVANALYGPFMAARQTQPMTSKIVPPTGSNNQRSTSQTNIIPKNQNSHSNRRTGEGGDSPFSPNSSEGDDLFEPPIEKRSHKESQPVAPSQNSVGHKSDKVDRLTVPNPSVAGSSASTSMMKNKPTALFDTLFGSPSKRPPVAGGSHQSSVHQKDAKSSKSQSSQSSSKPNREKSNQDRGIPELLQMERMREEVPSSAVDLRVQEKWLEKLNRQERVVEEVKLALKPHYGKKSINKDEYKEILRRAVPKICHNKSGEINPFKIKELIEAYVKKFRHARHKS